MLCILMKNKTWTVTDVTNAKYLGPIEFQDNKNEFHSFLIFETADKTKIVFGGACNVGFLESGYIEREEDESENKCLEELLADLEVYYNDGPQYVSRIVCNERM